MDKKRTLLTDLILALILIVLDQLTKIWAVMNLKNAEPLIIIKDALQLYYLPEGNSGAAFGILSGHRILFLIIAMAVVLVIAYALIKIPAEYKILRILLVFIAAGGAGNMIDRLRLGYVIDFIYFNLINFPIFNVADCYVTVSTISTALLILFKYKESDLKVIENAFKKPVKNDE